MASRTALQQHSEDAVRGIFEGCGCSRVKCHYPREGCTKHTMNDRIAGSLVTIAIDALKGEPPVPPGYDPRPRRQQPPVGRRLLCKSNPQGTCRNVEAYLGGSGEKRRRRIGKPLPKRVAWENRPKLRNVINLTPVVGDQRSL